MSEQFWLPLTLLTGQIGFTLSIVSNTILLFLIQYRSHRYIGSYKYLLLFLCFFTSFYSSVQLFLRPLIHIYDDTIYMINRKRYDWGKTVTRLGPTTYCGCYAMSFTMFALQFIHRYTATCRPVLLKYFDLPYFFLWILGALFIAISWACTAFFLFPQTERIQQSFDYVMNHTYGVGKDFADYAPYNYFYYDENGEKKPDLVCMLGVFQHLLVIGISYSVLFYCGIRTYLTLRSFKGLSDKTRDLQYQLFRALCVQAAFPMIFMYFPVGFMFSCPFFGLNLGATINYQTVLVQLYPGVDPMIITLLIDRYRCTVIDFLFCRFAKLKKTFVRNTKSTVHKADTTNHWFNS